MSNEIVITGLGVLLQDVEGKEDFLHKINNKTINLTKISEYIDSKEIYRMAGIINDVNIIEIKPIVLRQMDIATKIGVKASLLSLNDSDISKEDYEDIGIFMGTDLGGESFAEDEYIKYIDKGYKFLSPYLTISMFFSAVVGQLSILLGAKGFSKTYCAGECSSSIAIGEAYNSLLCSNNVKIIAGGYEKANTKISSEIYYYNNLLDYSENSNLELKTNNVLSDGAGAVVLEKKENAIKRGAKIYGSIKGFAQGFSKDNDKKLLEFLINKVIKDSGINKEDIKYMDYNMYSINEGEVRNLHEIMGNKIEINNLLHEIGNTIGANGSLQVISILINKQIIENGFALVITRSVEGNVTALLVEKNKQN